MVITVGLSIMLKNFFLFRFGGRDKPYFNYTNQVGKNIGPVTLTPRDMITTALSVIVLVAVALSLQYTRLGKATRAVSDNVDLASATGIDTSKVIRIIWVVGRLPRRARRHLPRPRRAGRPGTWARRLLFLMFAEHHARRAGQRLRGAASAASSSGLMVEMSTLFGVPTELKTVPALVVLILILLVRPQGILGRAQRVG